MKTAHAPILSVSVDRRGGDPAYLQLYAQLRGLILSGRLRGRARLPATRALATELGLSRGTVVAAYELLAGEGYIEGRVGSGAYVAPDVPEHLLQTRPAPAVPAPPRPAQRQRHPPFAGASAAVDQFPHADWARLLQHAWRDPPLDLLDNPDPQGFLGLRDAIAQHLKDWRGIDCDSDQIFILSGTTEGLELIAATLFKRGAKAWVEDPGYTIATRVLAGAGLKPVPVPVDRDGFDVARALKSDAGATLAVVTPSHQYPLGHTMSLDRRLALIDWARRTDGWIVEDDYASEYRYAGRPLAALMGLDASGAGRVLYCGTFSKVLFPALRLAYLVAPPAIVPALRDRLLRQGARASLVAQVPLARFIASGLFAQHIRRMRRLYAERQRGLLRAIDMHLKGLLIAEPAEAGMHLVARFTPALLKRMDDIEASERAAQAGVVAKPLSGYSALANPGQGLVLGFAAFDEPAIEEAARRLAEALSPSSGAGTRGRPSRAGRRHTR